MLVSIIPIGNSKGIRLPKMILDQLQVEDKLDLEVDNSQIILKPIKSSPRDGWEEAFSKMHNVNEDVLIDENETDSEAFEWVW